MSQHFADRLTQACRERGNALCVGLDPRWEQLPLEFRRTPKPTPNEKAAAFETFCLQVLDIVAPLVPVVKPQSAFFEACGPAGMTTLQSILKRAHALGLLTILDSKRNDVSSTAEAYADAVFGADAVWPADAMTINPYLGRDAVEPFLASARRAEGGVFVLVRTSNKGAKQFQDLGSNGKPLYEHVAAAVGAWAGENMGQCGLGDVGAVVGATHPAEMARTRALLPNVFFLVPGYGAQGGSARDTAASFRADGTGAIVNSSRGITAAFAPEEKDWQSAVAKATRIAIAALTSETPMGNLKK
jgi:orotidine-5'-phosphate decarboxylase